jgi:hypothetical protein
MSRLYQYECDGCGLITARLKSSAAPGVFADVDLQATGFRNWRSGQGAMVERRLLLCGDCQIRLQDYLDPRTWSKPIAADASHVGDDFNDLGRGEE